MNNYFFKDVSNIKLSDTKIDNYAAVDGLSLQNLFYARTGSFPSCLLFTYEVREKGDYRFDTDKMAKYLIETYPKDDIEFIPYYTTKLGTRKKPQLGFCIIIRSCNIYARFEQSVADSYILYDNSHVEEAQDFKNKITKFYKSPKAKKNTYYRISRTQYGYTLKDGNTKPPKNFDVSKLYNDDFVHEDEKIKEFISTKDKSGLVILYGEKGTGKSTYIKHLVSSNPDKKFVYVPANLVGALGDPEFGDFIGTLDNHIIILEDCENALERRETSNNPAAVSTLLNMTDGFLADDFNLKFICTFNAPMKTIDTALLRKGRLVSEYEFKKLSSEKSKTLLADRGITDETGKEYTLAEIFHYEDDSYEKEKKHII